MADKPPTEEALLLVDGEVIARHVLTEYLRHCGYSGSLHESDIYVRQQRTKPERQSVAFAAAPSSAL